MAVSIALAALSVAAGLVDPIDPFAPNRLFVADGGEAVFEYDETGALVPTYLTGVTRLTGLSAAHDLAFGPDGALYVSDFALDRVSVFDADGGAEIASVGSGSGLDGPTDLAFGPHGDLFVVSSQTHRVLRFDRDGVFTSSVGVGAGLIDPRGLAFAPDGHLFVSSSGGDEIVEFDPSGVVVGRLGAGSGLDGPYGLAFSPRDGRLYVASHETDEVLVFDTSGAVVDTFGPVAGLDGPSSLAFGPDGLLYVASENGARVLSFDATGAVQGIFGPAELTGPTGLAFSPFVLEGKMKGKSTLVDGETDKFSRPMRVTWAPGSGRASLLLLDPMGGAEGGADADPLFGHDVLNATGFESAPSLPGPRVSFVGAEIDASALMDDVGALGITFKGSVHNLTGLKSLTGLFEAKQLEGVLHKAGPDGATSAKLRGKLLK